MEQKLNYPLNVRIHAKLVMEIGVNQELPQPDAWLVEVQEQQSTVKGQ